MLNLEINKLITTFYVSDLKKKENPTSVTWVPTWSQVSETGSSGITSPESRKTRGIVLERNWMAPVAKETVNTYTALWYCLVGVYHWDVHKPQDRVENIHPNTSFWYTQRLHEVSGSNNALASVNHFPFSCPVKDRRGDYS